MYTLHSFIDKKEIEHLYIVQNGNRNIKYFLNNMDQYKSYISNIIEDYIVNINNIDHIIDYLIRKYNIIDIEEDNIIKGILENINILTDKEKYDLFDNNHPYIVDYIFKNLTHEELLLHKYSSSLKVLEYIEKHDYNSIDWIFLSANKSAIPILLRHPDKINWVEACNNANAYMLYRFYPDRINIKNIATYAPLDEIESYISPSDYPNYTLYFSSNRCALPIIHKILENEYHNPTPFYLWENITLWAPIELIFTYIKDIDYSYLLLNPNIVVYDYKGIKERYYLLHNELLY